jgi:hypothetical protein
MQSLVPLTINGLPVDLTKYLKLQVENPDSKKFIVTQVNSTEELISRAKATKEACMMAFNYIQQSAQLLAETKHTNEAILKKTTEQGCKLNRELSLKFFTVFLKLEKVLELRSQLKIDNSVQS